MCWLRILPVHFQCGSQPQNVHSQILSLFHNTLYRTPSTAVWCQQIAVHCIGKKCPLHSIKILTNGLKVKACKMRVHNNEIKTSERNENQNDFHTRWQYPPPFKIPQIPAFLWPLLSFYFYALLHRTGPKWKTSEISGVNLSCRAITPVFCVLFQHSMYSCWSSQARLNSK